jgi:hypothetical protein
MQAQEQVALGIEERIPLGEYERSVRVTRHAIDKLLERSRDQHVDWSLARSVEDIGNAVDLMVRDATARGARSTWWETMQDGSSDEHQVEIAELDLGRGRRPLYALIVPSDIPGGQHRLAVLTVLNERQYHGSMRAGRFSKEPRNRAPGGPPAKIVQLGEQLAAAFPGGAVVQVTADRPVNDPPPTRAELGLPPVGGGPRKHEHVAEVEASSATEAPGALLRYMTPEQEPRTMELRAWDDVPGAVADLVDDHVDVATITAYRLVPFRVKRAITITLGD